MNCIHGFEKDVEPPVDGMHRCSCCGLNGSNIYIQAGAKWPRADPLCQDCRDTEDRISTLPPRIDPRLPLADRLPAFIVVAALVGFCFIYKWYFSR